MAKSGRCWPTEQLLQDTDCPGWNDECLEESFASRLGSTRDSFLELVDLINSELSGMEARRKGFEEVAQVANTVSSLIRGCSEINRVE
jgi:hypothetical protein